MGIFRRKGQAAHIVDESMDAAGAGVPTLFYVTGLPAHTPQGPGGYTAGWKGMPGSANPSQQIGMFDGGMLSQFPAMISGVQRKQGRESGSSRWYYPSLTVIPNGSVQQTTKPNNVNGGQRYGSIYSGPLGPLSTRRMAGNVARAQVQQSGLQAMDWARSLSTLGTPSD